MKKYLLLNIAIINYFLFPAISFAQLQVLPGGTATNLVATQLMNNILEAGTIGSNATLSCATNSFGTFSGGLTMGIDAGIVFSTGLTSKISGTSSNTTISDDMLVNSSDTNLSVLMGAGVAQHDGCSLEFDIVASCNNISINYIFASEEYPEFVGSGYNDAFGFFISGPGITGTQNIALLPGTSTPVSIDNVNATTNSQYYVDNSGSATSLTVFDANTVPLTAHANLQCGQSYHIKLIIADAADGAFDSGIFIQGIRSIPLTSDPNMICGNDTILLNAPDSAFSYAWTGPIGGIQSDTSLFNVEVVLPGTYTLTMRTDTVTNHDTTYTFNVTQNINPPTANFSFTDSVCFGTSIHFTDNSTPAGLIQQWAWNFGYGSTDTIQNPDYTYNASGNYRIDLSVLSNGCADDTSIFISIAPPLPTPSICLATVDGASIYNQVIWEKPLATDIDSFIIYSLSFGSNQRIGAVEYNSLGIYTDTSSNPNNNNSSYAISAKGICGNESPLSSSHNTIFLQSSLTGGNNVKLNWNLYQGASVNYYRILRDNSGTGNFIAIDSVSGTTTSYFDNSQTANPNSEYRLNVIWQTTCSPSLSSTYSTSFSNIQKIALLSLISQSNNNNSQIDIIPNPANDKVNVNFESGVFNRVNIYNNIGQLFYSEVLESNSKEISLQGFNQGIYHIELTGNNGSAIKKLVKL